MNTSLYNLSKKYGSYIMAVMSIITALFYNELNIQALKTESPDRLEPKYDWVKTADDVSYLRPAENYYHYGIWRDNNPGAQARFLRTPGYGLFRYALMKILGFERSYFWFKYVQLLLFGISVFLLFQVALLIGLPLRYALIIEGIYGLSPFACGFIYYSLTEGITPALMVAYFFFLLMGYKKSKPLCFLISAIIMGYIGITRPVLLVFGAALPWGIYLSQLHLSFGKKAVFALLADIIALAPIGIWALRSTQIAGNYVGIYPIYYAQSNSQYRPTHKAIWEFQKSYGTEGRSFHQFMVPLWTATLEGDTSDTYIDSIMLACPDFVKETIGAQRLRKSYLLYRQSIVYQREHYPQSVAMPDTIPAIEHHVINDFHTYTTEINSKYWLWCHIAVPVKLFKALSFHSNLSLYIFQHTYRGRWWMEAIRGLFLGLHFLCCLSFVTVLLLRGDKLVKVLLGILIGVYLFYLCSIFRGLEERYTLPVLPLMLTGLIYSVAALLKVKWGYTFRPSFKHK